MAESNVSTGVVVAAIILGVVIAAVGYTSYKYFKKFDLVENKNVAKVEIVSEKLAVKTEPESKGIVALPSPDDSFGIISGPIDSMIPPLLIKTSVQTPKAMALKVSDSSVVSATPKSSAWKANNYKNGDINIGKYTVIRGDTLWEIAEGAYGFGSQWKKIANLNSVKYFANGRPLITVGQILNIP